MLFCSWLPIACLAACKRHSHGAFHWACHSWRGMSQPRGQFVICLPLHWNVCQAMENMVGMNGNLSTARSLSAEIRTTTYWVTLCCYYVTIPIFFPTVSIVKQQNPLLTVWGKLFYKISFCQSLFWFYCYSSTKSESHYGIFCFTTEVI